MIRKWKSYSQSSTNPGQNIFLKAQIQSTPKHKFQPKTVPVPRGRTRVLEDPLQSAVSGRNDRKMETNSITIKHRVLDMVSCLPKTTPRSWLQGWKAEGPIIVREDGVRSWGQWLTWLWSQTHIGSNLVTFKGTLPLWVHFLYLLTLSCRED